MKFDWKDFSESEYESPEEIVQKSLDGFSKATHGMVELVVHSLTGTPLGNKIGADFSYRLYLTSQVLPDYRYMIIDFGYDAKLNPVFFKLDPEIFNEIYVDQFDDSNLVYEIGNVDFIGLLHEIYDTIVFNELVSGLMKIAQKKVKS